ncbi:MAG: phage tail tape measure protein [Pseudomonadota bacterium]
MDDIDGIGPLEGQIVALEDSLGSASALTAEFQLELTRMQATIADANREVYRLSTGISAGLRRSFDDLLFGSAELSEVLKDLGDSILRTTYSASVRPVADHFGGVLGGSIEGVIQSLMPFAKGGAFTQGRVTPFASGGIVGGPTMFPMRGGMGLMGEAGPEAIMPLRRGADGKLGVQAAGGGRPVNVTMNISTPDVQGFQRSQGQIATQVSRALSRANRNR